MRKQKLHHFCNRSSPDDESTRDTYNYGQYINQFPPNTIKAIRPYEWIQKKICRQKMSVMLNEICINKEMLPKYTYINIYIYIYIYIYMCMHPYIYAYINWYAYHYHHHVVLLAQISLTLSHLTSFPYRSSPHAVPQSYIPYPHIAAVCMFEQVILLLLSHMWWSIEAHHLWACLCFSSSVLHVWFF